MDIGDLSGLIVVICLVAVPALALSARIALRPIVEAILRVREAFASGPGAAAVERRVVELEAALEQLRAEVHRLARAQEFHEQLQATADPAAGASPARSTRTEARPPARSAAMMRKVCLTVMALAAGAVPAVALQEFAPGTVATFSIVGYDPANGDMGVAVQSRYFAVGAVVPWAEPGVGVVATQAAVNTGYGPRALELLRQGLSPDEVVERLLAQDTFPRLAGRQLAVLDARGRVAVHTGPEASDWAGHRMGPGFSAQGNILAGPGVVDAMADAFQNGGGELAERLMAALEAGQAAGGDRRGQQSAAILVIRNGGGRGHDNDYYVRLHVDDHSEPIAELRRLLDMQLRRP